MAARMPPSLASSFSQRAAAAGLLEMGFDPSETTLLGRLVPQIDTNTETVVMSLKVGEGGLVAITTDKNMSGSRLLITDRRVVFVESGSARFAVAEYPQVARVSWLKIGFGRVISVKYEITINTTVITLKFEFPGVGFWEYVQSKIPLYTHLALVHEKRRTSAIDKDKLIVEILKAVIKFKKGGIIA